MSYIEWVDNDTEPVPIWIGADLTGATSITLHVHPHNDRSVTLASAAVTVTSAVAGEGTFLPIATIDAGIYVADVVIVRPTGNKTTNLVTVRVHPHTA